jgi:hypothetical protein
MSVRAQKLTSGGDRSRSAKCQEWSFRHARHNAPAMGGNCRIDNSLSDCFQATKRAFLISTIWRL